MTEISNYLNTYNTIDYYEQPGYYYINMPNGQIVTTLINSTKPTFASNLFKRASCNNGISSITQYSAADVTNRIVSVNTSSCKSALDGYSTTNGPLNEFEKIHVIGTQLSDIIKSDISIDCKNHPITYLNVQPTSDDNTIITYICGSNTTKNTFDKKIVNFSNNYDSIDIFDSNFNKITDTEKYNKYKQQLIDLKVDPSVLTSSSLNCYDKVISRIDFTSYNNNPVIYYYCKSLETDNTTSNPSIQAGQFFNTTSNNNIVKLNVATNNVNNPTMFWGSPTYHTSVSSNTSESRTLLPYNQIGMSANCNGNAISNISLNSDKTLSYKCGTPLISLENYSDIFPAKPNMTDYYSSGVLFNNVSCPNDTVLSAFSTTMSRDGPKVKWTCGKTLK